METALKQEFNATAEAACDAFRNKLAQLVVVGVGLPDEPIYLPSFVADQLSDSARAIKNTVAEMTRSAAHRNWAGLAVYSYNLEEADVELIALRDDPPGIFYPGFTQEMWATFVLDHELGHHVVDGGQPTHTVSVQHAESAADAFGLLRHIQRYGADTAFARDYAATRARWLALIGDTGHYTVPAIERVLQVAQERDVTKLSLRETTMLAAEIAADTRMSPHTLHRLSDAFAPALQEFQGKIGGRTEIIEKHYAQDKDAFALTCREIFKATQAHRDDAPVLKAGRIILNYPPFKKFMEAAAKTDLSWNEVLAFAKTPQKKPQNQPLSPRL